MSQAIDLNHLNQYVCGDDALLDEILCIFVEQAALWTERLDPGADDEAWRNAAHALKGASRGVGAWRIGDICEAAESLIGAIDAKANRRLECLAELRRQVDVAIREAAQIRSAA